ncbi:MAG: serine/threonine protein kinase, partial [Gemmatimonadetes bacterium]|nr:serine/threonine protein kinase [Gemmatimonadota bacterium]
MTPERWARIEELFAAALDLPEANRERWLAGQPDDPQVLTDVRALLRADATGAGRRISDAIGDAATALRNEVAGQPALGERLGPYRLLRILGEGGMGTVYLALDHRLKRKVALKVLTPEKAENQTLLKRFRAEAANAAQLRHENVVAIYDAGEDQRYNYITMEFVDGTDVQRLLDVRGRIPVRRSLEIVKQVALALQHADKSRIVHRDIKPANILITREGVVKLADLGLARSMEDALESGITRAGMTVGTVDYMSPEQAQDSKSADTRSDIYSLGCTWYQMVTGKAPFPDGSLTNKLRDHAHTKRPNPRDLNPDVPEGMVAVIQRMMAIKPRDRYQSPTQLLKELENPNILSESISRKLFDDDRSSSEIPEVARQLLDDVESETEMPAAIGRKRSRVIHDDDEEEEKVPAHPSGRQPTQSGKQTSIGGKSVTESGKRGAVTGSQKVAGSQKMPARELNKHGRISRREREDQDAHSWQWRGATALFGIAAIAVVVVLGGFIWDQVKSYVIPQETVVSQDLGPDRKPLPPQQSQANNPNQPAPDT